jgi:tRNA pseudouridine13 synthase
VVPSRDGAVQDSTIAVSIGNVTKVNAQIRQRKAAVTGVLYGSDSVLAEGPMGEIERAVIAEERLTARDFIIPEIPYLSSSGARRPLLCPLQSIEHRLGDDTTNQGSKALALSFTLSKGSYATSLLREILKAREVTAYV